MKEDILLSLALDVVAWQIFSGQRSLVASVGGTNPKGKVQSLDESMLSCVHHL